MAISLQKGEEKAKEIKVECGREKEKEVTVPYEIVFLKRKVDVELT